MSEDTDWAQMTLRLEQLARDLADLRDVEDTLEGAVKLATELAPCDVASVSLRRAHARIETTAASDPVADKAHERQQELGEGPCVETLWDDNDLFVVTDIIHDERWPHWGPEAEKLGLSSLLAVKLFTNEQTVGALDLYSFEPREYDGEDVLAARVVAARVSAALASARREETLQEAMDARNQIGQAQGILMERYGLSAGQAFAVLRRYSQEQNRKLRHIAQELIAKRDLPDD